MIGRPERSANATNRRTAERVSCSYNILWNTTCGGTAIRAVTMTNRNPLDHILRYLLLIRMFVVGGQYLALVVMDEVFGVTVAWDAVNTVLALFVLFTLGSWLYARQRTNVDPDSGYLTQLVADLAALSMLVYFTGGSFNPFISLFLLPIVFAAAALPGMALATVTMTAVACYTLLMLVPTPDGHPHGNGSLNLHVWGMWYGFILSAACVALLVAKLARHLRARDREIAALREEALGAERVMALGTLAAGMAHELGTPLSTMAVLAGELEHSTTDPAARAQISTLRSQIQRCKSSLAHMSTAAGGLQAGGGRLVGVDDYIGAVFKDWRDMHPEVQVTIATEGPLPAPSFVADRVLTQAIVNVLDNAAQAANSRVDITGHWSAANLAVTVADDGDGIDASLGASLGREVVSTKEDGLGIGVLLARAILERLGGDLELEPGTERGTLARILIPITPLSPT